MYLARARVLEEFLVAVPTSIVIEVGDELEWS
jgi:hypothetical protein